MTLDIDASVLNAKKKTQDVPARQTGIHADVRIHRRDPSGRASGDLQGLCATGREEHKNLYLGLEHPCIYDIIMI